MERPGLCPNSQWSEWRADVPGKCYWFVFCRGYQTWLLQRAKGKQFRQQQCKPLPSYLYLFDSTDQRRDVTVCPYFTLLNATRQGQAITNLTDGKYRRDWLPTRCFTNRRHTVLWSEVANTAVCWLCCWCMPKPKTNWTAHLLLLTTPSIW